MRTVSLFFVLCLFFLGSSELGIRQNFQEMKKRRVGERQPLRYEEEAAFEFEAGAWMELK